MTEETLKKANEIVEEMEKLKTENDLLKKYKRPYHLFLFKDKSKRESIFIKMKPEEKQPILFELTQEDIDLLFNSRLKKYQQLEMELVLLHDV